jgi:hypothetical protein
MQQSDITGANISSASQEIYCILWNPEVHCCVHDRRPIPPVLTQTNQLHTAPSYIEEQLYYYLPIDKIFRMVTLFQVSLRPKFSIRKNI